MEREAAADCGNPDGVTVVGDPLDYAVEEVARVLAVEGSKIQRVRERDGVGPHRERVPDDATHTRRRAVVRVDVGGVVVALDAEGDVHLLAPVVARQCDHGGVVARPDHDLIPFALERREEGS